MSLEFKIYFSNEDEKKIAELLPKSFKKISDCEYEDENSMVIQAELDEEDLEWLIPLLEIESFNDVISLSTGSRSDLTAVINSVVTILGRVLEKSKLDVALLVNNTDTIFRRRDNTVSLLDEEFWSEERRGLIMR